MLASIDRVLPDATKLTITGIALAVAPDAGVTVVGAPTAIPDLVEGAAVNVLVDLRLEAAALGAQTVGTATLSLYQGEVSEVVPLRLERVERAVAVPVPSELRAERLRVRAGAALGVVQREVAAQRLDVALEHVREVARDARDLLSEPDVVAGPVYRSLNAMATKLANVERTIARAHEGETVKRTQYIPDVSDEATAVEGAPDQVLDADAAHLPVFRSASAAASPEGQEPTYRGLSGGGGAHKRMRAVDVDVLDKTALPRDFVHQLVDMQNGLARL